MLVGEPGEACARRFSHTAIIFFTVYQNLGRCRRGGRGGKREEERRGEEREECIHKTR